MKKRFASILLAVTMTISSFSSFAGQWVSSGSDWYYMTDDGNYAKDVWLWLDENHDGKAEFYHFNNNGILSQNTRVTIVESDLSSYYIDVNESGAAKEYITMYKDTLNEKIQINPIDFPPYSIFQKLDEQGVSYQYLLKDNPDHYNFKEVKTAWIDPLIDYGNYYAASADLQIWLVTGDITDIMECSIPTTAYFSKDCMVGIYTHSFDSSDYEYSMIPISLFLASQRDYCQIEVISTDSNGYITSCYMWYGG